MCVYSFDYGKKSSVRSKAPGEIFLRILKCWRQCRPSLPCQRLPRSRLHAQAQSLRGALERPIEAVLQGTSLVRLEAEG